MPGRDYTLLLDRFRPGQSQEESMRAVVDGIWDEFHEDGGGVSWAGFYTWSSTSPDEMTLGYRRDKPACSPIGLHGACGKCFLSRKPLVVTDVARLGAGYIACDPRDRSEVVVPLLNPDGSAWAVLDVDSHEVGSFDVFDALTLARLLSHAGLSASAASTLDDVVVV
jgi:putative methionine-R-sulfoxide reductase with GAF domain